MALWILIPILVVLLLLFIIIYFRCCRKKVAAIGSSTSEKDALAQAAAAAAAAAAGGAADAGATDAAAAGGAGDGVCLLFSFSGDGRDMFVGQYHVKPTTLLYQLRCSLMHEFKGLPWENKLYFFLTREFCDVEPKDEGRFTVADIITQSRVHVREDIRAGSCVVCIFQFRSSLHNIARLQQQPQQ